MNKLIIAFDIGTTFSGASYCWRLADGRSSNICPVTSFPSNYVGVAGSQHKFSKVPTQIFYDEHAKIHKIGPEVPKFDMDRSREGLMVKEKGRKAEWFKLRLRPASLPMLEELNLPELPASKTAVDAYADFLRYLYDCTKKHICASWGNGLAILEQIGRENTWFVITHPNGWEWAQQASLRTAAKTAGLISEEGDEHLHLLTEGEAALHFCVRQGHTINNISSKEGVIVIDAGGGTVDLSAFRRTSMPKEPVEFEEIAIARCIMHGSMFITKRAETWLEGLLRNSSQRQNLQRIVQTFDQQGKTAFIDPGEVLYLQYGGFSDNDESLRIEAGTIAIPGETTASFFEPSLEGILKEIKEMVRESKHAIKRTYVVGGLAENAWFFDQLRIRLKALDIEAIRPDGASRGLLTKAIAEGAVSHALNIYVKTRIVPRTYGARCSVPYDPQNLDHDRWSKLAGIGALRLGADGCGYIENLFCPFIIKRLIPKGTPVKADKAFTHSCKFFRVWKTLHEAANASPLLDEILCYRGDAVLKPDQEVSIDEEPHNFDVISTLETPLDREIQDEKGEFKIRTQTSKRNSAQRSKWYRLDYKMMFTLGTTELRVQSAIPYKGRKKSFFESQPKIYYLPASAIGLGSV